jgi:hypothetical protein
MKVEVKQALTVGDCLKAITISTQLYQSSYSDNESRMLYASAHACNAGIQLYQLIDDITNSNFTDQDSIIRTFVRLFPSTAADSKMASSWFALDALQSILNPGVVVSPTDQINYSSVNPASDRYTDRTSDANTYLAFLSMAEVGTTLNRYGYSSGQSPASLSYAQGQDLPWINAALIQADNTGAGCSLVAGFYNLVDGITVVLQYLTNGPSAQLQLMSTLLSTGLDLFGMNACTATYTQAECEAAKVRVRYRNACTENGANAAFAAGVIFGINTGWSGP